MEKIEPLPELFHCCALFAYFLAIEEGKQDDSGYVKKIAYKLYEEELARGNADKA